MDKLNLTLCSILMVLLVTLVVEANKQALLPLTSKVLQAHNLTQTSNALYAVQATATKRVYAPGATTETPTNSFERIVSVSTYGTLYKRTQVDPLGMIELTDLISEESTYHMKFDRTSLTQSVNKMEGADHRAVQSAVTMFGLTGFLRELQQARQESELSLSEDGYGKFTVLTDMGEWTLYINSENLICKIQMVRGQHHITLDFSEYKEVSGTKLPFVERVSADGMLVYKISFTSIDLHPVYAEGYFDRDTFAAQGTELK